MIRTLKLWPDDVSSISFTVNWNYIKMRVRIRSNCHTFDHKINVFFFKWPANDSIFVRASKPDQLYTLKDGIQFHLFVDTVPCGDARIFSPDKTVIRIDKHPNR